MSADQEKPVGEVSNTAADMDQSVDAEPTVLDTASSNYINTCGMYRRAAMLETDPVKQQQMRQQADVAIDLAEQTLDYKDASGVHEPVDERMIAEIVDAAQKSIDGAVAVLESYNSQAASQAATDRVYGMAPVNPDGSLPVNQR
eukprot:CAMPEP_0198209922 /NCGR_PEP_ID=MMETSP1445-20131203/17817_1 /TAXON_ID=36898 /ORGANISM="Pyramimonas sp., Strain CCMP2087" /LENGTH=143 /DNA_ID=CAMNT_0043883837 /DNA_START=74 /DNA_END=505 /DNA_ORIENTATION=+